MPLDQTLRNRLTDIVGAAGAIADPAAMAPYLHEERGLYHGVMRLRIVAETV